MPLLHLWALRDLFCSERNRYLILAMSTTSFPPPYCVYRGWSGCKVIPLGHSALIFSTTGTLPLISHQAYTCGGCISVVVCDGCIGNSDGSGNNGGCGGGGGCNGCGSGDWCVKAMIVTVSVCCLWELLQWGGGCLFPWSLCSTHSLHVFHGQVRAGAMLACGRGQPSIDQWMQFAADSPTNSHSALPFTASACVITATINPIRIAVGAVEVSAVANHNLTEAGYIRTVAMH